MNIYYRPLVGLHTAQYNRIMILVAADTPKACLHAAFAFEAGCIPYSSMSLPMF
jgi:hypothetical protein